MGERYREYLKILKKDRYRVCFSCIIIKAVKISDHQNLFKGVLTVEHITIIESKNHVGEEVEIGAWVANKRSSGKIAFLQLRDGSGFFQGIVVKSEVEEEVFQLAKSLNQETSILLTGVIQEDARSKFGYEIAVKSIKVIGESHDYPIYEEEIEILSLSSEYLCFHII